MTRKFVLDPSNRWDGSCELREVYPDGTEGIICWIIMDEHPNADKDKEMIYNAISQYERLEETRTWAAVHHSRCEQIHGAECVPSEEDVARYEKHPAPEQIDWEEE